MGSPPRRQVVTVCDGLLSWQFDTQESKPSADLAISIQASQGHLGHLEDLLRALAHPAIAIMVHLDAKAPDTEHEELTQLLDAIRCVAGCPPPPWASLLPGHITGQTCAMQYT